MSKVCHGMSKSLSKMSKPCHIFVTGLSKFCHTVDIVTDCHRCVTRCHQMSPAGQRVDIPTALGGTNASRTSDVIMRTLGMTAAASASAALSAALIADSCSRTSCSEAFPTSLSTCAPHSYGGPPCPGAPDTCRGSDALKQRSSRGRARERTYEAVAA